jgi:Ca-activated chloride channel family protein
MKLSKRLFLALILISFLILPSFTKTTCAPSSRSDQDDEVVRIDSDLVVLNLTVTDVNGRFVEGLKRSDFKVFEDGVSQTISSFETKETPFAAAVLMDFSGSMEARVTLARSAAIRFLDGLRDTDVAAVYRFDFEVTKLQDFGPDRDLASIVFDQRAKGLTVLNDAIVSASRDLVQREEKRRAIVILSDGMDTHSSASSSKALAAAASADATIYAVDLSDPTAGNAQERMVGTAALKNFTSKTGGRYVSSPGGVALREAFGGIVTELGNQYTIAYRTTNHNKDGKWRAVSVTVSKPGTSLRTRKGYFGSKR